MADTSVVIGCTSAIGRAISAALLDRGDYVIGTTRSQVESDSRLAPDGVEVTSCDATRVESIRQLFERFAGRRPRHLIYCAGFHRLAPVTPLSAGSLMDHMLVNFQGAVDCARLFVSGKYSCSEEQRTITVVASIAHRVGEPGLVGYSASKAAVVAAVRGMAAEYASKNVRVNSVSPGWIEGDRADAVSVKLSADAFDEIRRRYPLGLGSPADVASAVAFLSSNGAKWITGIDMVVDGGRTCT